VLAIENQNYEFPWGEDIFIDCFELIQPKIILAAGRIAAQSLLRTEAPVSRLRGKVHTLNQTPVIVVYHPSYLLRSPNEKKKAWLDLQLALNTYQEQK